MASVTFPEALGGNGQTYTDDADPNTGLDGLGYTIRFIPCLQQAVAMGLSAKNDAQAADGFVQQCQTLRQEAGADRQAVAEDRAAVEQHLQDAQVRIGTTQALIDARDTALGAQAGAIDAEAGAVAAQTSAEAARDAAVVSGHVYPDTSAGLTATSDGQYFKTVAANQAGFLTLWRNNAGVATEIETYPSLTGIAQALEQANRKQTRLARSLQRLGDHGQTLHSDFDLDAHGLGTALVGGVQDALDSGELWTTVRETPTLAYQHVEDGTLKYVEVPPNVLAREWNPETGRYQQQSPLGATNELRYSNDFSRGIWIKGGSISVVSDVIDGPIQNELADKLVEPMASGIPFIDQVIDLFAGNSYCRWVIVKQDDAQRHLQLQFGSAIMGVAQVAAFNLKTGETLATSGLDMVKSIPLSDGYYLCYAVITATVDAPSAIMQIRITENFVASNDVYTGDGTSGIYIAHSQLVNGTSPGPVIVTEAAPVTRSPDQISRLLGAGFNQNEGTLYWEGIPPSSPVNAQVALGVSDNTGNNRTLIRFGLDPLAFQMVSVRNGVASSGIAGVPTPYAITKVALSYDLDGWKWCANGGPVKRLNDVTGPVVATTMHASNAPGSNQFGGKTILAKYAPAASTDAELQALTAIEGMQL